jgi:hypothetical protein
MIGTSSRPMEVTHTCSSSFGKSGDCDDHLYLAHRSLGRGLSDHPSFGKVPDYGQKYDRQG